MADFIGHLNFHTPNDFRIWNLVQFEEDYGQTMSSSRFGVVFRVRGDSVPGEPRHDTYFLLINSHGFLYTGVQVNGRTQVVWTKAGN